MMGPLCMIKIAIRTNNERLLRRCLNSTKINEKMINKMIYDNVTRVSKGAIKILLDHAKEHGKKIWLPGRHRNILKCHIVSDTDTIAECLHEQFSTFCDDTSNFISWRIHSDNFLELYKVFRVILMKYIDTFLCSRHVYYHKEVIEKLIRIPELHSTVFSMAAEYGCYEYFDKFIARGIRMRYCDIITKETLTILIEKNANADYEKIVVDNIEDMYCMLPVLAEKGLINLLRVFRAYKSEYIEDMSIIHAFWKLGYYSNDYDGYVCQYPKVFIKDCKSSSHELLGICQELNDTIMQKRLPFKGFPEQRFERLSDIILLVIH